MSASPASASALARLDDKPRDYYVRNRASLISYLDQPLGKVLDVGCGAGGTSECLRSAGATHIVGVELDPAAAEQARTRHDDVVTGAAEDVVPQLEERFETILCYDVLEHLVDPASVLRMLHEAGVSRCQLHVSVPNARHFSLARDLVLRGTFGYTSAGHRDSTHLRWFTRSDIQCLLEETGWAVDSIDHAELQRARRIDAATAGLLREFFVGQWYVRCWRQEP